MSIAQKTAIVSCVNDFQLYEGLRGSLSVDEAAQLCPVDNTSGQYSVPSAYNYALKNIDVDLFVFVHQDVIFPSGWFASLAEQIKQVERIDKEWGVLGIMGVRKNGWYAGHILDPHTRCKKGRLPSQVVTLDEVCLIIRKSSGLSFDEGTGGYHFYGADLCLQAQKRGMKCYAIDASMSHLSGGKVDESFYTIFQQYREKWSQWDTCPSVIETTCGVYQLKKGIGASICFRLARWRRRAIAWIEFGLGID